MPEKAGLGVDIYGNPVIDPTKNVLDLVRALEITNEKLRAADTLRQDDLREADRRFSAAMRESEMRRLDQLAMQRMVYNDKITEVQRKATEATTALVLTQLREMKIELDVRMSKQEQFRWESGGASSGQAQFVSWAIAAASVAFAIIVYALK